MDTMVCPLCAFYICATDQAQFQTMGGNRSLIHLVCVNEVLSGDYEKVKPLLLRMSRLGFRLEIHQQGTPMRRAGYIYQVWRGEILVADFKNFERLGLQMTMFLDRHYPGT